MSGADMRSYNVYDVIKNFTLMLLLQSNFA